MAFRLGMNPSKAMLPCEGFSIGDECPYCLRGGAGFFVGLHFKCTRCGHA